MKQDDLQTVMQEDDQTIQALFYSYQPELGSTEAFMDKLNKRLDDVAYVKQYQDAQIHRYKMAVLASLICGVVLGGVFIAFMLQQPLNVPLFQFNLQESFLLMIEQNSRLFAMLFLSALICVGIISIVNIIQEMANYKAMQRGQIIGVRNL